MYPFEAQRMSESAARWRVLAWAVTVVGGLGVLLLAIFGARETGYGWYGYETRFSVGGFFAIIAVYGVLLVVTVSPLFLTCHVMNGLTLVMRGLQGGGWARAKAANWRVVSWVLTVLGLIVGILLAVGIAEIGNYLGAGSGDSAAAGFVVFLVFAVIWMLEIWPLFMLCRTMDGIGVLVGEATSLSSAPASPFQPAYPYPRTATQPPAAPYQPAAPHPFPAPSQLTPPATPELEDEPAPVFPAAEAVFPAAEVVPSRSGPVSTPPTVVPGWRATHRVPTGGLPARRRPDPTLPVIMRIAEGVELMVTRQQAEWALVQTDQGWKAWVDARRLEPVMPLTPD